MRDFERDIIAAATVGHPLTGSVFSWSFLRHQLFFFCRRAYFIRYYLAQGGWNRHSHELTRYAYFEKHLPDREQWLAGTMEQAISRSIKICRGNRKDFIPALSRNLSAAVRQLQHSLENESWMQDPKLPGLLEVFHYEKGFRDIEELTASMIPVLRSACEVLLKSQAVHSLNWLDWKLEEKFLQFRFDSFPVWLHGGLRIAGNDGKICSMLRFCFGQVLTEYLLPEAALWQRYSGKKETAYLIFTPEKSEEISADRIQNIDIESFIGGSSAAMLSMIQPDGTVCLSDFPKQKENPEQCRTCRYRQTCGTIDRLQNGSY